MTDYKSTDLATISTLSTTDVVYICSGGVDYQTTVGAILKMPVPISYKTADYTAALADAETLIEMNSASATVFTIPPNSSVAFPIGTVIEVARMGAGAVTINQGSGVTINPADDLAISAQFKSAFLRKTATDTWIANVA